MRRFRPTRKTRGLLRAALVVVVVSGIIGWQAALAHRPASEYPAGYMNWGATGVTTEPLFFFFLYRLDLLPLTTTAYIQHDTTNEAQRILWSNPGSLRQSINLSFASGDWGRMYLYFVDALFVRHDGIQPSLRPANSIAFCAALVALFVACVLVRRPWVGLGLVALLGSNPHQLTELYGRDNIHSWTITGLLLVTALNVRVITVRVSPAKLLATAFATGVLLALLRSIRSEAAMGLIPIAVAYVWLCAGRRRHRWLALAACLVGFFATTQALDAFFRYKRAESAAVVKQVGGVPFTGPHVSYHELWHPLLLGLCDFGSDHGYTMWDDQVNYRYAAPILRQRLGHAYDYLNPNSIAQSASFDGHGLYPIPFGATPGYEDVIRDRFVDEVTHHPFWYLNILALRVRRVMERTTPWFLRVPPFDPVEMESSPWGWLALATCILLLFSRSRFEAFLMLMSLAPSIPAVLVYSDRGMTLPTILHYFFVPIAISLLVRFGRSVVRETRALS